MPKMRTKSAAKKRFKKTGGSETKIKRSKAFHRHLLTKKTTKNKRDLRGAAYVHAVDLARISLLLPY